MDATEERRQATLRNLSRHAGPARGRLCLSLADAARLVGITPEILGEIENARGCALPLAALTHLARSLGLTEVGEPRPLPPGRD